MRPRRGGIFFVDFPLYLLVVFIALFLLTNAPTKTPPHVRTFGQFAVVVTWPGKFNDDVDTYVRDPAGSVVWYDSQQAQDLHLEHDDTALGSTNYGGNTNFERVVLRSFQVGEYTVNLHLFAHRSGRNIPVVVELWSLRGNDRSLLRQEVTLSRQGEEATAFRFTLDASGNISGSNRLPISLLKVAQE